MRPATWLFALLLLAAVACGGGQDAAPAAPAVAYSVDGLCETDAEASLAAPAAIASPTPRPSPVASVPSDDAFEPVLEAVSLIKQLYVYPLDRFDRDEMLLASWRAAVAYLDGRGVATQKVPAPVADARLSIADQNARFRSAYGRLVVLAAPAGIENRAIADAGIGGATAWLNDEHTRYLSARRWDLDKRGKRLTFGYRASAVENGSLVEDVTPGSSAERAGMKRGDVITGRQSVPDSDGETEFTISRAGSTVTLRMRQAEEERGQIRATLVDGSIGVVRLSEFAGGSCDRMKMFATQLNNELRVLSESGAQAWVVDLRGNPGGLVRMAAYVAGRFGLQDLLAMLRDSKGNLSPVEMISDSVIGEAPLVVLVNQSSASSSEVFAGAFQQTGRATVVGTNTAGAVVGSRKMPLKNGGGLYVTVTLIEVGPEGKRINNVGVKPDIEAAMDRALLASEGRDSQLEAAIDYLKAQR